MHPSTLNTVLSFLNPIKSLMDSEEVTEIMVNAPHDVWVKRFGRKHEKTEIYFDESQIRGTITILASVSNRQVGDKTVDASSQNIISAGIPGFRFEAWNTPVAVKGPGFTVRKLASKLLTLDQYVASGAIPEDIAILMHDMVASARNIFVAGATGSGKTTFCNALLQCIPSHERLLVIETIHELIVGPPNHVLLEADDEQGYSINRLLVSALRGLPHRIIIGEVRGSEAYSLLKAANTGHPGAIATLHANSAIDSLERLEDMVFEGRPEMPLLAIRRRIANTRPFIVFFDQVERNGNFVPTLTELCEVVGIVDGEYSTRSLYNHPSKEKP